MISNLMKEMRLLLICCTMLISSGVWVHGQTQSEVSEEKKSSEEVDTEAKVNSATALGDIFFKSRNSLIFGFNAAETNQDNALFGDGNHFDSTTNLASRVAYQRQYQRTTLALDYTLGGRIYNRYTEYNQLTHDGGFDVHYRFTPRLSLSLGDRISISPQAGRLFQRDYVVDPLGSGILPNTSLLLRLNKSTLNTAYAELAYDLSRKSNISFGANNSISRFDQANLREQNRYGTSITYSHKVAARTTLNAGYNFNYFDVSGSETGSNASPITPSNIVRHHYPYAGITQQLTPAISVFVNAGPSITIGDSVILGTGYRLRPGVHPSVNAGIVLSRALALDPRTFVSFNVGQNLSDGLGLGAVSQVQSAGASIGRRFTKRATGAVTVAYSRNQFLTDFDQSGREITTNGITIAPTFRINVTEQFNFHASYFRYRQLSTGFLDAIPGYLSGNVFAVGISYNIPVFF
jgi:hypothetical protein